MPGLPSRLLLTLKTVVRYTVAKGVVDVENDNIAVLCPKCKNEPEFTRDQMDTVVSCPYSGIKLALDTTLMSMLADPEPGGNAPLH